MKRFENLPELHSTAYQRDIHKENPMLCPAIYSLLQVKSNIREKWGALQPTWALRHRGDRI
jgi:hypothetical protein